MTQTAPDWALEIARRMLIFACSDARGISISANRRGLTETEDHFATALRKAKAEGLREAANYIEIDSLLWRALRTRAAEIEAKG